MTKFLLAAALITGLVGCAIEPPATTTTTTTASDDLSASDPTSAAPAVAGCRVWESDWDCNGDGVEDYIGLNSNPLLASQQGRKACTDHCPTKTCVALGPVYCTD